MATVTLGLGCPLSDQNYFYFTAIGPLNSKTLQAKLLE